VVSRSSAWVSLCCRPKLGDGIYAMSGRCQSVWSWVERRFLNFLVCAALSNGQFEIEKF
jgi:hypothetical protein